MPTKKQLYDRHYRLKRNKMIKLYNADCLEAMKNMEDECIDLTVTSPPYNCGIDYDVYDDNKSWNEYLKWCTSWLKGLYRITKNSGRIALNVLLEMGIENNKRRVSPYADFYHLLQKVGFKPFGSPVWVDSHRVKYTAWGSWLKSSAPYIYCPYEIIIIAYKGNRWKRENGKTNISKEEFMMGCSGIWKLRTQTKEITKSNFHEDLPNLCIKLLSGKGDTVFDPFTGSGTTGKMSLLNKRHFIGCEISKEYCDIAVKRIEDAGGNVIQQRL